MNQKNRRKKGRKIKRDEENGKETMLKKRRNADWKEWEGFRR